MGFLLFSASVTSLTSEITSTQYDLKRVTDEYNKATQDIADFQQAMSDAKQMTSVFTSGFQSQEISRALTAAFGANSDQFKAVMSGNYSSLSDKDMQKAQTAVMLGTQGAAALTQATTSVTNNIFSAVQKAKEAQLQAKQKGLDLRKGNLEQKLTLLQNQKKSYESQLGQAAQDAAPKFSL